MKRILAYQEISLAYLGSQTLPFPSADLVRDMSVSIFFCLISDDLLGSKGKQIHQEFSLTNIHTPHNSKPLSWQETGTGEKLSGKIFTKISGTKSQEIK
jgi:hypothetical protein